MARVAKPYSQALALQKLLNAAARSADIKPSDLARVALAWERLEDRKRILRGRGLPKVEARKVRAAPPPGRVHPVAAADTTNDIGIASNTATGCGPAEPAEPADIVSS